MFVIESSVSGLGKLKRNTVGKDSPKVVQGKAP
jgi:hypothetical protein